MMEELGDLLWYAANFCKFVNMDFANLIDNISYESLYNRSNNFSLYELMELITINATALDVNSIYDIVDLTLYAIELIDGNLDEILDINIRKLAARYPEGFSSYYALNRNLDNSRSMRNWISVSWRYPGAKHMIMQEWMSSATSSQYQLQQGNWAWT
jgi:hypothetical protein